MTPNEVRRIKNLPPIEGGNKLVMASAAPANNEPAKTEPASAEPAGDEPTDPEGTS
jgi:hypothetical protein